MTQSLAQKRAKDALHKIQTLAKKEKENKNAAGNYVSYVKALPATIIMSGLGQALAMEKAGAKDAGHRELYTHINDWLCKGWKNSPYKKENDVLKAITSLSEGDYIRAQAETMEYLEWLKKFAVAELTEKGDA